MHGDFGADRIGHVGAVVDPVEHERRWLVLSRISRGQADRWMRAAIAALLDVKMRQARGALSVPEKAELLDARPFRLTSELVRGLDGLMVPVGRPPVEVALAPRQSKQHTLAGTYGTSKKATRLATACGNFIAQVEMQLPRPNL